MSRTGHADDELTDAALAALHAMTGVTGRRLPRPESGREVSVDVAVEFDIGDRLLLYYGECKGHVDRGSLIAQVKHQLDRQAAPGILIAPHLTDTMLDACRAVGLQSIDTAGNAYLNAPGLYVFVKGQKDATMPVTAHAYRGGNASASRMIFVLLVDPALTQSSYRAIAAAAGIALGSVGPVFDDLARRSLVTGRDQTYGRRILEPQRLIDEWSITYPVQLRPKLNAQRFNAPDPEWWRTVDPVALDAWWSGDVAADRLTGQLQPATQTLYIAPDQAERSLHELIGRYRLRPASHGTVEILDAFWTLPRSPEHPDVAPPLLVYADLMASLDPRNLAIAKEIREGGLIHVKCS